MIEDVVIGVDKERVFSRWSDEYDRRGQLLNVHYMVDIERQLPRVDSNLSTQVSFGQVT
jgi:hypothetical protein